MVTTGTVTAANQSAYNARKPILVGENILENAATANWYELVSPSTVVDTGDVSAVNASFPTTRVYDRHNHLVAKPTRRAAPNSSSGYGIIFDLGSTDYSFDCVVIAGHNLSSLQSTATSNGGDLYVQVWAADDINFTTNVKQVATFWGGHTGSFTDNKPLTSFDCGTNHGSVGNIEGAGEFTTYSSVRYLQISVYDDTNTTGASAISSPELGEVFIGTRRQLSAQPNLPLSTKVTRSNIVDFNAKSGVVSRYVMNTGQKVYPDLTWEGDGSDGYGLDDIGTLESFFKSDITHGTKPFFYAPDPVTNPREIYFMLLEDAEFGAQNVFGPDTETVSVSMTEVSPFYSSL